MSEDAKNLALLFGKGTREAARSDRGLAAMFKYFCCRSPIPCSFWKRCKDSSKIKERFSEMSTLVFFIVQTLSYCTSGRGGRESARPPQKREVRQRKRGNANIFLW
jgi:hypothetical protein